MLLAIDGKAAGLIGVADPIKLSTPDAIRALHDAPAALGILPLEAFLAADDQGVVQHLDVTFSQKEPKLSFKFSSFIAIS